MTTRPETDKPTAWARRWPAARPFSRPMPRAGAWYPVVGEAGPERVVLLVRQKRVAVPRRFLEIRDDLPSRFTVVVSPRGAANPATGTPGDLGRTYGVCPRCGSRVHLLPEQAAAACRICGHRGEVAWWETG